MEPEVIVQEWWVPLIGTAATAIAAVLTYLFKRLVDWIIKEYELSKSQKEAGQALLEGMAKAQEEFVREAKKASADGKLTKAEVDMAKSIAWKHAADVAKGPAREIVVNWTEKRVASLIKQLLARFKGGKDGTTKPVTETPADSSE